MYSPFPIDPPDKMQPRKCLDRNEYASLVEPALRFQSIQNTMVLGSAGHRIITRCAKRTTTDLSLAEAAFISSVEMSDHVLLSKRLEVVDVESLGLQPRANVGWDQLLIQFGSDGQFCAGLVRAGEDWLN